MVSGIVIDSWKIYYGQLVWYLKSYEKLDDMVNNILFSSSL